MKEYMRESTVHLATRHESRVVLIELDGVQHFVKSIVHAAGCVILVGENDTSNTSETVTSAAVTLEEAQEEP